MRRVLIPWTQTVELPTRTHQENLEDRYIQGQNERLDMGTYTGVEFHHRGVGTSWGAITWDH